MSTIANSYRQSKGLVRNSILILMAFAITFFPRVLDTIGFPSIINFAHFAVVPLVCAIAICNTRTRNREQIAISQEILLALFLLLLTILTSAFVNDAGAINVILSYLLLAEPYILLLAIICIPISANRLQKLRLWILGFGGSHILLAFSQKVLLSLGILKRTVMTEADNVQGVFYLSGAGHVVGASVSMAFGLYFFVSAKKSPMWMRVGVFFAAFVHLMLADAKQTLIVWFAAWFLLILTRVKDLRATLQYLVAAVLATYALMWCIENLTLFSAFKAWIRPGLYGPDGEATLFKTTAFRLIPTYYESVLNWFLGLGPGHTVGRLGGGMLKDYWNLFGPLGATLHPVGEIILNIRLNSWLNSSFFSPLFGWAGIWGDLGFVGLAAYLYLASVVWHRVCLDDFSRFMMLTVVVFGSIFTQMEEPAFMLTVAILIGLRWQEIQSERRLRPQPS